MIVGHLFKGVIVHLSIKINWNKLPGVKSPSDSTLYTPALQMPSKSKNVDNLLNTITNFVESVQIETSEGQRSEERRSQRPQRPHPRNMMCQSMKLMNNRNH